MRRISLAVLLFVLSVCGCAYGQGQQIARIGDLKLENGNTIRDCVIGYRTYGTLNQQQNNVVLYPTALGGRSADLAANIGAGKLLDSNKYYVVAVDSLGDGVSSSPSNSKTQPRLQFPQFSIRDMVNAEHRMLTDSLHLTHVHAVVGYSMGGMQAFQWAVSFPEFTDKVVSIAGSPQVTSWELLWQRTELLAIEADPDWNKGQYTTAPKLHLADSIFELIGHTPEYVASKTPVNEFEKFFSGQVEDGSFDATDLFRQIQACSTQDIAKPLGGSLERAAGGLRAAMLVIVNRQDHVVTPTTSVEFAKLVKAQLVELDSTCGHSAPKCEKSKVEEAVAGFLEH